MDYFKQQIEKQNQLESSVLGTIMKNNYLLDDTNLEADYFTLGVNKSLFNLFKQLRSMNKPIDVATVLTANVQVTIDSSHLMFLSSCGNERNFDAHVQILFEGYQERRKIEILNESLQENRSINDIIKNLQSIESNQVNDYHNITTLLADALESPFQPQKEVTAHKTGLKIFDAVTGGLRNSELIILAARPSVGKTAVALNLMRYLTQMNKNIIPIFFSLEMSAKSIRNRLIASLGNYDSRKLDNPHLKLTEEEKKRWVQALTAVQAINLETFDSASQKMSDIRRKTRKMSRLHKDKQIVVFVDYLQIVKAEDRNVSEYDRITKVSNELKAIAKDFNCPVVALSQLNRESEGRGKDKRPMMSDLRGSGAVEQDADVIALLHREDYYETDRSKHTNEMEINIAKNRNAGTGMVVVRFDKSTQTIFDK